MRRLAPPANTARAMLLESAEVVQSNPLRVRLVAAADTVEATEAEYRIRGPAAELFAIASTQEVGEWVNGPEMETLYTGTFARLGSPVRHHYDTLKSSARNNICPSCAQRVVGTLDHFLPQSTHPALTVAPINLLPCCADCNKSKLHYVAASSAEQLIHPYFDDVDDAIWLVATVGETTPPTLQFVVSDPPTWPLLKCQRMRQHFKILGLGALYASHSGAELENLRFNLQKLRRTGGPNVVRQHLLEQEESRRDAHRNSWQAALYAALAASPWFCDVGVNSIPPPP